MLSRILRIDVGEKLAKTQGASECSLDFLTGDQAFVFFAAVEESKRKGMPNLCAIHNNHLSVIG